MILQTIRDTLSVLNSQDVSDEAKLETSDIQLKSILENLSLSAPPSAGTTSIDCLQNEYNKSGAQIIIFTHSTILASKINLKKSDINETRTWI